MKAISPVIATVIIVAVAIAISIAVALWITGMTSSFTGVEKLEVVNAYATGSAANNWTVTISIKNTGTKPATIDNIFINNKPYTDYTGVTASPDVAHSAVTINAGASDTITLTLPASAGFSSGQTVSIVIHTASGGQYPATVTLP